MLEDSISAELRPSRTGEREVGGVYRRNGLSLERVVEKVIGAMKVLLAVVMCTVSTAQLYREEEATIVQEYPVYLESPGEVWEKNKQEYEGPGEVVSSGVIRTVDDRNIYKRTPYPFQRYIQDPCIPEFCHFKILRSLFGNRWENAIAPKPSPPKETQVHHKESFQSPILITVERPGYKFVKHLVGPGHIPDGKQFQVLILEKVEEGKEGEKPKKEESSDHRGSEEVEEMTKTDKENTKITYPDDTSEQGSGSGEGQIDVRIKQSV